MEEEKKFDLNESREELKRIIMEEQNINFNDSTEHLIKLIEDYNSIDDFFSNKKQELLFEITNCLNDYINNMNHRKAELEKRLEFVMLNLSGDTELVQICVESILTYDSYLKFFNEKLEMFDAIKRKSIAFAFDTVLSVLKSTDVKFTDGLINKEYKRTIDYVTKAREDNHPKALIDSFVKLQEDYDADFVTYTNRVQELNAIDEEIRSKDSNEMKM